MDDQRTETSPSHPYLYVYTYGLLRLERNNSLRASPSNPSVVPEKEWEERPGPTLALLKLLICSENRHGTKSYLAGTLWPDTEEEKARHSLAQASRVLRGVLRTPDGKSQLMESSGGSGLHLGDQTSLWVDADAFEHEVRQAIRADHDGRKDDGLSHWEHASTLGKAGTFLPDDMYQDWTNARRLNHDRLYRRCVHRLGECYLSQGRYDDAEAILRPFWVHHLIDEDILFLLMKVAIARGDRSEAFWFYERTRQALKNELGVQPLAATTALVEQLRTNATAGFLPSPSFLAPQQIQQESATRLHSLESPLSVQAQSVESEEQRLFRPAKHGSLIPAHLGIISLGREDPTAWFGGKLAHLLTIVEDYCGLPTLCLEFQEKIGKELNSMQAKVDDEGYTLSRRQLLITLATLPTALLLTMLQGRLTAGRIDQFLTRCAASLVACWHLMRGSEYALVEELLPTYLPLLASLAQESSKYQSTAASLATQGYRLKGILALHRNDVKVRDAYFQQAVYYAEIAQNPGLLVAALISLVHEG